MASSFPTCRESELGSRDFNNHVDFRASIKVLGRRSGIDAVAGRLIDMDCPLVVSEDSELHAVDVETASLVLHELHEGRAQADTVIFIDSANAQDRDVILDPDALDPTEADNALVGWLAIEDDEGAVVVDISRRGNAGGMLGGAPGVGAPAMHEISALCREAGEEGEEEISIGTADEPDSNCAAVFQCYHCAVQCVDWGEWGQGAC